MSIEEWDRRYEVDTSPPAEPNALVRRIAEPLPAGRALELACGTGANALWLAAKGWEVTAVDGSKIAIERLRQAARDRDLKVHAAVADLEENSEIVGHASWDLILICHYLQRGLFANARAGLASGGVVIAITLLAESPRRYRLLPGELKSYFADWEILHYREEGGTAEIAARVRRTPR